MKIWSLTIKGDDFSNLLISIGGSPINTHGLKNLLMNKPTEVYKYYFKILPGSSTTVVAFVETFKKN